MSTPPKEKKEKTLNDVCGKDEKSKKKEYERHTKGDQIKFCAHQYLYISEQLGLGLGRKLYLPPPE